MKKFWTLFCALSTTIFLMPFAMAGTEDAAVNAMSFMERLKAAGKFFGIFLLTMAMIFAVLTLTKRIAAWIEKRKT